MQINSINSGYNNSFKNNYYNQDLTNSQKAKILATSALGVGAVFAVLAKRGGYSLNPKNIVDTPIKEWAIFKYDKTKTSKLEPVDLAKPLNIIFLAAGSVLGGFIGGVWADDSNIRAKKQEALAQILGNVITPVACVAGGIKLFNKFSSKIISAMPQIKPGKFKEKTTEKINKAIQNTPKYIATMISLGIGIFTGNKVCNFINEKLYHKECNRGIEATDFAPHLDDLCMALSMSDPDSAFSKKLSRFIPLALIVPGYETGKAR